MIIRLKHSNVFDSHKNGGVFPEMPGDVKNVLRRLESTLYHSAEF
jgi:hypothetical protein